MPPGLPKKSETFSVHNNKRIMSNPCLVFPLISFLSLNLASGSSRIVPATSSFDEGFFKLFGDDNFIILRDGKSIQITLNERTGSGFISQDMYRHGFFSAAIKLPADYTAGVVVAFYMSNGERFEKSHDEIDFEFLGNIRGRKWRLQTNVYGNGSTSTGREERYNLWFDPSENFHRYSILWTDTKIIFYVDNIPIREVQRTDAMGADFPSKPMSLYATIWDGSGWATGGGKYKINYKYAPFIAEFSDLTLHGCSVNPMEEAQNCDAAADSMAIVSGISPNDRSKMSRIRRKHMTYSHCYDRNRYAAPLPECVTDAQEARGLRRIHPVTFGRRTA